MLKFTKKLKKHFKAVLKTKKSPHSIALGFAVGSFIALLPIPFIDLFIGLLIIAIFAEINKYSLILGIFVWNPLTKIPIYAFSYKIGSLIFGDSPVIVFKIILFDNIYDFSRRFLVGNLILALSISIISYLIVYGIMWLIYFDTGRWKYLKQNI